MLVQFLSFLSHLFLNTRATHTEHKFNTTRHYTRKVEVGSRRRVALERTQTTRTLPKKKTTRSKNNKQLYLWWRFVHVVCWCCGEGMVFPQNHKPRSSVISWSWRRDINGNWTCVTDASQTRAYSGIKRVCPFGGQWPCSITGLRYIIQCMKNRQSRA